MGRELGSDLGRKVKIVYFDVLMSLASNTVWLSSETPSSTLSDATDVFLPTEMIRSEKFSAFRFRVVQRRHAERPFVDRLSPILSRLRSPMHSRQESNISISQTL